MIISCEFHSPPYLFVILYFLKRENRDNIKAKYHRHLDKSFPFLEIECHSLMWHRVVTILSHRILFRVLVLYLLSSLLKASISIILESCFFCFFFYVILLEMMFTWDQLKASLLHLILLIDCYHFSHFPCCFYSPIIKKLLNVLHTVKRVRTNL